MSYVDEYGRLHHKPITTSNPVPSNNGWVYTAFFAKAGGQIKAACLKVCYELCKATGALLRSPGKYDPPISRDEILGLSALKLLKPEDIKDWNFSPYKLPKFNLFSLLKQLWELRPTIIKVITGLSGKEKSPFTFKYELVWKHRNYFWENDLDQIYRFAFKVPVSDRHFLLKNWDKFHWYNPIHVYYAAYGKLKSLYKPNALDWLKYGEKRGLIAVREEFTSDNPIQELL